MRAIKEYSWPGNIRELENKIKRAVILSNSNLITAGDLGLESGVDGYASSLKEARRELELKFIKKALKSNKGNISSAAREIGISRVSFYDLMKKNGIKYKP